MLAGAKPSIRVSAQRGCCSPLAKRRLLTTIALLQTLLVSAGLTQGVPSLQDILQQDGAFAQYCTASDPNCEPRVDRLQVVAWLGFVGIAVGQLIFGIVLDWKGPRFTCVAGLCVSFAGFMTLSRLDFSTQAWLIGPAYLATSIGGTGPYISAMNIANVWARPSVFIAFNTGAFGAAGWVYMGAQELFSIGVSRPTLFAGFAVLVALFGLLSLSLFPDNEYEPGELVVWPTLPCRRLCCCCPCCRGTNGSPDERKPALNSNSSAEYTHAEFAALTVPSASGAVIAESHNGDAPLDVKKFVEGLEFPEERATATWRRYCRTVVSFHFVGFALFFGLMALSQAFYASSARNELYDKGDIHRTFASAFVVIGNTAFVFSPLVGYWMSVRGHNEVMLAALLTAQAYTAINFLPNLDVQIVAFALLSLNRALTFTSFYSYIFNGFDPSMYGRLLGTLCLGSSLCSLSQPALSSLVAYKFHGNYTYVNIGFTCLPVVLYPWICMVRHREHSKRQDAALARRRSSIVSVTHRGRSLSGMFDMDNADRQAYRSLGRNFLTRIRRMLRRQPRGTGRTSSHSGASDDSAGNYHTFGDDGSCDLMAAAGAGAAASNPYHSAQQQDE